MTDKQQPDTFDWATELSDAQEHVTLSKQEAKEIGARLRNRAQDSGRPLSCLGSDAIRAECETLRTGYAAARLEIESLKAQLHVGDSTFESWYSSYNPTHKGDKQRARDAYAAGMGDSLVMAGTARQALIDVIAQGLSGTWHCLRVWSAWNVGTMSQDDFSPVDESDTPAELADAVLALLAAAPIIQPAPQQEAREPAKLSDEQIKAHGDKASRMMARDLTRFDAACEVDKYLREQGAPGYYRHRMSIVLFGNVEGTEAARAPDTDHQPSPAAQGDALDAARYRWLRHGDNDEKVLKTYTSRPGNPGEPTMFLPRNEHLDRLIDAARAAQEGK